MVNIQRLSSIILIIIIILPGCKATYLDGDLSQELRKNMVDKQATAGTVSLYNYLRFISGKKVLFGHQEDTRKGYGWKNEYGKPRINRSDVQETTGSYPAVYGWDFENIAGFYTGATIDYEHQLLHDLVIDAFERGGINTFSWHYNNPVSKISVRWQNSPVEAVSHLLPGKDLHELFKQSLKQIATFVSTLNSHGRVVPVIFRPFHEMNGDWFWWGAGHCTTKEYQQLYQFTVSYLRDSLQVHNFLYAWSPDRNFTNAAEYLLYYPGDDYVDILGIDNYYDLVPGASTSLANSRLQIVTQQAKLKNKIAAYTETGLENITDPYWFTKTLLPLLRSVMPAYVLLWSNSKESFWTPPPENPAAKDFIDFKQDPVIQFGSNNIEMYNLLKAPYLLKRRENE